MPKALTRLMGQPFAKQAQRIVRERAMRSWREPNANPLQDIKAEIEKLKAIEAREIAKVGDAAFALRKQTIGR